MIPTPSNPPQKRFRKGRLTLWISLGLILLVVLGHHIWTTQQRAKLMAAIQRYRQAGEPVLPEDFAPPSGEDPDNPVPQWRAAVAALKLLDSELQRRADWKELSVPLTEAEDQFLEQVLSGQQEALALAAKAAQMHGKPEWGVHFVSPVINSMFPDLREQRELASMLQRSALHAHHHGDDAQAVDRITQIVAQSRSMQHHPTLVAHLVALGMEAMACDTARKIGPELRIGPSDRSGRPASLGQVRQLIADLLDERAVRDGQVLAYRTERMMEVDSAMQLAAGNFASINAAAGNRNGGSSSGKQGLLGVALAPQFYGDARLMLDYTTGVLKASQARDLPSYRAQMSALPDINAKRGVSHLLISIFLPAFDRQVQQDFQILTESRLTAVLLACRMYALDHGGQFPAKLDNLVPNYLPSVPADPFTAGATLRYRAAPDAIVYGVGENGIDDGGSDQPIRAHPTQDRWDNLDVVTHLILQPYQAPPEDEGDAAGALPTPSTQSATAPTTAP